MSATLACDGAKLRLAGRVGFANADVICAEGLAAISASEGDMMADLAELDSPSSVSVAILLRWARALSRRGHSLRLQSVPEKCRAIMRVSGLTEALPEGEP